MAIITGTNGDDKEPNELEGTNLADQIFGLAGNDTLVGLVGDDLLEGGAGADQLFGGDGLDLASYRGSPAAVSILLYDDLTGDAAGGDAIGDRIASIEGAIGSAYGDGFYGNGQRNVFRGEGGNDRIEGAGGNDRLEGGGGNDVLNGGPGNDELLGGDGRDTADFIYGEKMIDGATFTGVGVVADLAAGTATGGDLSGSDRLTGIEDLHGTFYNDRLAGNAGANRLDGDVGADELVGRGGADRFVYDRTYDSSPVAPDRIVDFSRSQGDRIDLSGVDANERPEDGDQTFRFVGQAQFTGAGQVRFFQQDGDTVVEANTTDSTAGAELRIVLDPLVNLQATDFVL